MSDEQSNQGSQVSVRATVPADVPRVWELLLGLARYEQLTEAVTGDAAGLHEALFGQGHRLRGLVAEQRGRLVGYALFYPVFGSFRTGWRLWLEDLFVEPEARGSGAGVALMAALAHLTLDGGYHALDWEVIDWNRPAIEFYERLGAQPTNPDWLSYRVAGAALAMLAGRRDARS
ncbi:MAG: GNAT family N-acetyltransferase [Planctomycetota bacterium]|nr:GNAT family N-acetyltransferase [Planctomycetota bacterium]